MSSSLMEIVTSPVAVGDAMRREERNWDDILPLMDAYFVCVCVWLVSWGLFMERSVVIFCCNYQLSIGTSSWIIIDTVYLIKSINQ